LSRHFGGLLGRLGRAWSALFGSTADSAPSHPSLAPQTRLTFIPTPVFVQALFEVLKPAGWAENEPLTFAAFWRMLNQLPDDQAGPLKLVLKSMANDPAQSLDAVRKNLAQWFDAGMEQASTWYRRRMRTTSIVIGALLAFILNIDSIEVANRFYRDANM